MIMIAFTNPTYVGVSRHRQAKPSWTKSSTDNDQQPHTFWKLVRINISSYSKMRNFFAGSLSIHRLPGARLIRAWL